jgi:hypothetical protein
MMLLMKPRWTACFAAHFPLICLRVCVLIGVVVCAVVYVHPSRSANAAATLRLITARAAKL